MFNKGPILLSCLMLLPCVTVRAQDRADLITIFNGGVEHLNAGRFEQAAESLKKAIEIKPDMVPAHFNLAFAYLEKKLNDLPALLNLGLGYFNLRRYEEAIEPLKKVIEMKSDTPSVQRYLGEAYLELGRLPEATEMFRRSIRLKPDQGETRYLLGVVCLKQGDLKCAEEQYKELKKIDPAHAEKLAGMKK